MIFAVNFGKRLIELGFAIAFCFLAFVWYHFFKGLKGTFSIYSIECLLCHKEHKSKYSIQ